jgi:hypothetical protein
MLVLQKSAGLVWAMPSKIHMSCMFLVWIVIWTFSVSQVVASGYMETNGDFH